MLLFITKSLYFFLSWNFLDGLGFNANNRCSNEYFLRVNPPRSIMLMLIHSSLCWTSASLSDTNLVGFLVVFLVGFLVCVLMCVVVLRGWVGLRGEKEGVSGCCCPAARSAPLLFFVLGSTRHRPLCCSSTPTPVPRRTVLDGGGLGRGTFMAPT